jgi:hypothetical protein
LSITVDLLFSADLAVEDTIATANLLVERLGLPPWKPTWTDSSVDDLLYLRASHPFSPLSPTLIELIRPDPKLPACQMLAPQRPVRTHANVLVTKTFDELSARLAARGIRRYDMPVPGDNLSRLFPGIENFDVGTPGNAYDPASDGHLYLEIISWEGTIVAERTPIPLEVPAGGITRVVARSHLVPDLDESLARLVEILDWSEAEQPPSQRDGVRYAVLHPAMETSAALELVEAPNPSNRCGAFFARWGPGPYAMRLGVRGLDAKARDLGDRGTPFTVDETPAGDPVLLVDADSIDGLVVEFVEDPLPTPS